MFPDKKLASDVDEEYETFGYEKVKNTKPVGATRGTSGPV
jgi:hypothetical protein